MREEREGLLLMTVRHLQCSEAYEVTQKTDAKWKRGAWIAAASLVFDFTKLDQTCTISAAGPVSEASHFYRSFAAAQGEANFARVPESAAARASAAAHRDVAPFAEAAAVVSAGFGGGAVRRR